MNAPHGNTEDVVFAYAAEEQLAASLRATASELEFQLSARSNWASEARRQWSGRFAERFDRNQATCLRDGHEFVAAMRDAANKLDELARLARDEQKRRDLAREWAERQEREWLIKDKWDDWTGSDKPPVAPPTDGPRYGVQITTMCQREG